MIPTDKLFAYGKFITETELQKITRQSDYLLFHHAIEELIESGLLSPVKVSGSYGRIPPLFNKYRIINPWEDYAEYMESIRRLNPHLNIFAYLQRPELYCIRSILILLYLPLLVYVLCLGCYKNAINVKA